MFQCIIALKLPKFGKDHCKCVPRGTMILLSNHPANSSLPLGGFKALRRRLTDPFHRDSHQTNVLHEYLPQKSEPSSLAGSDLVARQRPGFRPDRKLFKRTVSSQAMRILHSAPRNPSPADAPSPLQRFALFAIPYELPNSQLTGSPRPWHWCIFALTGPSRLGTVYQLSGWPGHLFYRGPRRGTDPDSSTRKRRAIEIGMVWSDELSWLEKVIEDTPVSQTTTGYNCQNWTVDVLERLQARSPSWVAISPMFIQQFLKQQETQGDVAPKRIDKHDV